MRLTLLSKRDCHLCEAARQALEASAADFSIAWEERELTEEEPLFEKFKHELPVLLDGDEILCAGRIDSPLLERIFSLRARPGPAAGR